MDKKGMKIYMEKNMDKKVRIALKKDVGSIYAIFIYYLIGIIMCGIAYLIWNIANISFPSFIFEKSKLCQISFCVINIFIFAIWIKFKANINNKKDFIQKFMIVSLCLTCITTFLLMHDSKKEIRRRFQSSQMEELINYDVFEADSESRFYYDYKDHVDPEIKNRGDIKDYFAKENYKIVDEYVYQKTEQEFLKIIIEIVGIITCVKLVEYTDRKTINRR